MVQFNLEGIYTNIIFIRNISFNSLRPSDAYIYVSKLTIIGSDNGLLPGWCQAIILTNDGILLIWTVDKKISVKS